MKYYKLTLLLLSFVFFIQTPLKADAYFLDFNFILNESNAGKKANQILKKQLDQGVKNLKSREKELQNTEKNIIQQKKILSAEEYKKKITELRTKVSSLQKDRNKLMESISSKRNKARKELLNTLNPIVKNYMKEKNIKIVLDKKNILLGDENLNITKNILDLLNKELKTLKLN